MHADLQNRRQGLDLLSTDDSGFGASQGQVSAWTINGLLPPCNTQNLDKMDVAGLVSSIITFVDFSWTIVRGTYDIHSSISGATEENVHVGNVLQDLRDVTQKMRTDIPGHGDHERALLELEDQCRGLSSDLAAMLQKLTVKRRSGLQSLNTMLRSLMKEKEVREIEKRLSEYRSQMILRLNLILLERSVATQNSLESRQDIESAQLRALKHKAKALTGSNSILRRLYFDDMYKRADSITDATYGTFDWLLTGEDASSDTDASEQVSDNEATRESWHEERERQERQEREMRQENAAKLSDFLEHGNGVFFLRGKPGSGKSTLMKYLIEGRGKKEVDRKLRNWAGQKRLLVRASAMFLLHGTPLQSSLEGFYRTLFFELLCQCPDLEETLFPKVSKRELPDDSYTSSIRLDILQAAWQRLLSIDGHDNIRICVSIDGMDELEGNSGDRFKFARALKEWAESEDIKIVCSGRPNAEFNTVFRQPHLLIDLQDLTRVDVRKILEERFEEVKHLGDLTRESIEELVNDISYQSEGVILWAVLVGKSLEDDIIHGQSLNTMKRTIQALPSGIEDLFNDMVQQLPRNTQQQLNLRAICGLLDFTHQSRVALNLSWLSDALSDSEFPYKCPIKTLQADELISRLEKVRGLLVQCTRHFVEVDNPKPNDDKWYLKSGYRFIHRSAQEFMQSKFNLVGSAQQRPDSDIWDLSLRLSLMFEMSVERETPAKGVVQFFQMPNLDYFYNKEEPNRHNRFHQLQPRTLEKLREILEFRRGLLHADSKNGRITEDEWMQLDLCSIGISFGPGGMRRAVSLFHLALAGHQVDYITRLLEDRSQDVGREGLCIGLLICAAGDYPSCRLFNLLVDHGADPDCLVEVYHAEHPSTPDLIPLWLLFVFKLAFKASARYCYVPAGESYEKMRGVLHENLYYDFLILERFLQLGYGSNVKFLAAPGFRHDSGTSDFEPDERDLFGMDMCQIIRFARPDNMDQLLLHLDSPRSTFLSLVQELTNFLSQPQLPFRALPQGATTIPYKRVSDEYLISEGWTVWAAFDGEHEIIKGVKYNVPTY